MTYTDPNRHAIVEYGVSQFLDGSELDIPIIHSTVNVCIMYPEGRNSPVAVFSRVYGNRDGLGLRKLMEYFKFQFGMDSYIVTAWVQGYLDAGVEIGKDEISLSSVPISPLIKITNQYDGAALERETIVFRYPDLPTPRQISEEGAIQIYDVVRAVPVGFGKMLGRGTHSPLATELDSQAFQKWFDNETTVLCDRFMGSPLLRCAECGDYTEYLENTPIYESNGTMERVMMCSACRGTRLVYLDRMNGYARPESVVRVWGRGIYGGWSSCYELAHVLTSSNETFKQFNLGIISGSNIDSIAEFSGLWVRENEMVSNILWLPNDTGGYYAITIKVPRGIRWGSLGMTELDNKEVVPTIFYDDFQNAEKNPLP
jgi:hypothetical protein